MHSGTIRIRTEEDCHRIGTSDGSESIGVTIGRVRSVVGKAVPTQGIMGFGCMHITFDRDRRADQQALESDDTV